jgi:uncharacterized YigZ family protein
VFHISKSGIADQTINKSRFIGVAEHCTTEREVMTLLQRLATEHAHAHHLVFAYKIQNPQGGYSLRFHDAGEPSGTAGKPILQYLEGRDLVNACVAVVRYFGGVKLGTGGLARAYGGTAKLALDAAVITPFVEMRQIKLIMDYARLDGFTRELAKLNGQLLDKHFDQRVTVLASVPAHEVEALKSRYPQT